MKLKKFSMIVVLTALSLGAAAQSTNVQSAIQDLKKYGVPSTGRLQILELTSDKMVLSGEEGTLRFRKY